MKLSKPECPEIYSDPNDGKTSISHVREFCGRILVARRPQSSREAAVNAGWGRTTVLGEFMKSSLAGSGPSAVRSRNFSAFKNSCEYSALGDRKSVV